MPHSADAPPARPARGAGPLLIARLAAIIADEASLSPAERARADAFRYQRDRRRFVARRSLLRHWIADLLGCTPASVPIVAGAFGKPLLPGTGLHCSASHADGVALLAVSADHPVGCDIVREDASLPFAALVEQVFSPAERRAWHGLSEALRPARFFEIWACKEAIVKAHGCGIALPLARLSISVKTGCIEAGGPGDPCLEDAPEWSPWWSLSRLAAPAGFQAALAACGPTACCRVAALPVSVMRSVRRHSVSQQASETFSASL